MSYRDAVLEAVREASALHESLKSKNASEATGAPIDVFGAIRELGVPLLFRPLDNLLGACVRVPGATGIMVTTERGLHLQRFTAAHELGHYALGHEGSLDREVGVGFVPNRDVKEIAADAFAAEFLLPRWSIVDHCRRHGWSRGELRDASCVYQLSLRLGVSYEATCLALQTHNILAPADAHELKAVAPKAIKQQMIGKRGLENWTPHVWRLDPRDAGQVLEAGPDDVFLVDVPEHSGGGYIWDTSEAVAAGFEIVADSSEPDDEASIGGACRRQILMRLSSVGMHGLSLSERRPWELSSSPVASIALRLTNFGKEELGVLRRERPKVAGNVLN